MTQSRDDAARTAPVLFDHALLRARQARAAGLGAATFLLDRVTEDLLERLGAVLRAFTDVADVGSPGAALAAALSERYRVRQVDLFGAERERLACAPETLDLAVSALALQFVNDLPGVLAQIRRALRPDGLFLAAVIGGDTLTELRQAFAAAEAEIEGGMSPRVAPFADLRDLGALLQ
jgi:SAM-dependent methyltransferase